VLLQPKPSFDDILETLSLSMICSFTHYQIFGCDAIIPGDAEQWRKLQ
jgi:hypothetical protein